MASWGGGFWTFPPPFDTSHFALCPRGHCRAGEGEEQRRKLLSGATDAAEGCKIACGGSKGLFEGTGAPPTKGRARKAPHHSLVLVAEDAPDQADGNAEDSQEQHAHLGALVEVGQVVVRDPEDKRRGERPAPHLASGRGTSWSLHPRELPDAESGLFHRAQICPHRLAAAGLQGRSFCSA